MRKLLSEPSACLAKEFPIERVFTETATSRTPVLISLQVRLHLSMRRASICLRLTLSPLGAARVTIPPPPPQTKTSKLKISALTDVITISNVPVNTDEGGQ